MSRYPRKWRWPNDAKIAVSIGLAFEEFEKQSQYRQEGPPGKVNQFSLSYAAYGHKAGIWRLLDLLDEFRVKANMTTSGLAAERHPQVVAAVAGAGHEIVGHGWVNDRLMLDSTTEQEREEIERCTQAIVKAAGVRPVGWTSPGSTGTDNTLELLKEAGYIYGGDDASDDLPFLHPTRHGPMVIMPRTNIHHNDLIMWIVGAKNPPSIIWDGFKDTFDELYREGQAGSPKWTEITIHAHMGGRPTLIPTLRKCLAYASTHDGVWFATRSEIARWTLQYERESG